MSRLITVSNRLPVSISVESGVITVKPSAGGLATGLARPHQESGGIWIGWPGDTGRATEEQAASIASELAERRLVPCALDEEEVQGFYRGFSNGILWPLFHYLPDRLPLQTDDWEPYRRVNRKFAETIAAHHRPGDIVWIHDYHLLLVPGMLRELLPEATIGFFLHIPFPATEVFRILPWRQELLQGILGADLVGFHTNSYVRHFANSLIHILGESPGFDRVTFRRRVVRFAAFPMGVDVKSFAEAAEAEDVVAECLRLRDESRGMRLLVGIDRLDYTKGIPRRLLAFDRFLEKYPEWRGQVRLVQIAVPSRGDVEEYEKFTSEVHQVVGRINGAYATPTFSPVHYIHRGFPQRELIALYRAADVMVVTPLRDGMNLVAKEFVACRTDDDGVLLLSEFAGAAAEMGEAMQVNPFDIESTADAIHQGLRMPEDERRLRMKSLRGRICRDDIHHWVSSFLEMLDISRTANGLPAGPMTLSGEERSTVIDTMSRAPSRMLVVGYDGTLVPFAGRPELANPDPELADLLRSLVQESGFSVHVVSGRSPADLERLLGDLPVNLHGEHGLWSRFGRSPWQLNRTVDPSWKKCVRGLLEEFTMRTPGSSIEEKSYSVAWHYRLAESGFADWQARELKIHLAHLLSNQPVEVVVGDKVVELRPNAVNKGMVVHEILRRHPGAGILAAGDDQTDEDLFVALPTRAITVHVGRKDSRARFTLHGCRELRALLRELVFHCAFPPGQESGSSAPRQCAST